MAIILLPISSRQLYTQLLAGSPVCPVDPNHPLVKNGTYTRHADSIAADAVLTIQRYLCRVCETTYSALPYDLRPYSTATWGVTLAVGAVWRVEFQWTWKDCLAWLEAHHLPYHLRTLQRWAARRATHCTNGAPMDCRPVWHPGRGRVARSHRGAGVPLAPTLASGAGPIPRPVTGAGSRAVSSGDGYPSQSLPGCHLGEGGVGSGWR